MSCHSCNVPVRERPSIRIFHSIPGAPSIDVEVNHRRTFHNVGYGQASTYKRIKAGVVKLTVKIAKSNDTFLIGKYEFLSGNPYTIIVKGLMNNEEFKPTIEVVLNHNVTPNPGCASVRFLHLSPGSPAVDVFVGGNVQYPNVRYGKTSIDPFMDIPCSYNYPFTVKVAQPHHAFNMQSASKGKYASHMLYPIGQEEGEDDEFLDGEDDLDLLDDEDNGEDLDDEEFLDEEDVGDLDELEQNVPTRKNGDSKKVPPTVTKSTPVSNGKKPTDSPTDFTLIGPISPSLKQNHVYTLYAIGIYKNEETPLKLVLVRDWPTVQYHEQVDTRFRDVMPNNNNRMVENYQMQDSSSMSMDLPPMVEAVGFPITNYDDCHRSYRSKDCKPSTCKIRFLHTCKNLLNILFGSKKVVHKVPSDTLTKYVSFKPSSNLKMKIYDDCGNVYYNDCIPKLSCDSTYTFVLKARKAHKPCKLISFEHKKRCNGKLNLVNYSRHPRVLIRNNVTKKSVTHISPNSAIPLSIYSPKGSRLVGPYLFHVPKSGRATLFVGDDGNAFLSS